jgi:hypothetical protein
MKDNISFIYAPYIYFESYKNSLGNVRKHYPTADIFIYMDSFRDDIEKYRKISDEHNCKFTIRESHIFYTNRTDSIEINEPKMIEVCYRLTHASENTSAEWMMILEDDVVVKRPIQKWPNADVGTCRAYFRPGGGSIFKREIFLNCIKNTNIQSIIRNVPEANWAADVVLENIFRINDAKFEEWIELAEPEYRDNTDHAIYHGYKDLYKLG